MTADLTRVEWALYVMAASLVVQTVLLIVGAVAAWRAYESTAAALERQLIELRATTAAISAAMDRTAATVNRSADAANAALADMRRGVSSATAWVDTVASAVTAPRTVAAASLFRGIQWWRQRRRTAQHTDTRST